MVWTIEFSALAEKQLSKLNPRDAGRIIKLLEEVAQLDDPKSRGHGLVGKLGGYWRFRAGDWRIITRIEEDRLVIVVMEVGHRREVYR